MSTKVLTLFGEMEIPDVVAEPKKKPAAKKEVAENTKPVPKTKPLKPPKEQINTETATRSGALTNWNGDKQYYTIGEVATIFKVNTSNIRFWTKEFDMKVRTTRKGDRLYTPEQVREINTIYHLVKERGFTINGAKAKLKENRKATMHSIDLKKSLQQLREKLVHIRKQLS